MRDDERSEDGGGGGGGGARVRGGKPAARGKATRLCRVHGEIVLLHACTHARMHAHRHRWIQSVTTHLCIDIMRCAAREPRAPASSAGSPCALSLSSDAAVLYLYICIHVCACVYMIDVYTCVGL